MLDWEVVADVGEEPSRKHVGHFEEGPDTDVHFKTLVTKDKSEIRQNTEGAIVM